MLIPAASSAFQLDHNVKSAKYARPLKFTPDIMTANGSIDFVNQRNL